MIEDTLTSHGASIDNLRDVSAAYPESANAIQLPRMSDIARITVMARSAPARRFPDGNLVTVPANEEQIIHLRHVSEQWDDKVLKFDDFIAVESRLDAMPFSQVSRQFLLVPEKDKDGLSIRSSAQLHLAEAIVAFPGDSVVRITAIYAGSLGTPLEYRRRGHAFTLITDLLQICTPEGKDDFQFHVFLTRDGSFYKNLGYDNPGVSMYLPKSFKFPQVSAPATDTATHPELSGESLNLESSPSHSTINDLSQSAQPIYESEIDKFVTADAALMREDCRAMAEKLQKPVVSMIPSTDCLQYRSSRSTQCFQYGIGSNRILQKTWTQCGCSIGDVNQPNWAYILWRTSYSNKPNREKELVIARARYNNIQQLRELLGNALKIADEWGLINGVRWNTSSAHTNDFDELGISYESLFEGYFYPYSKLSRGSSDNLDHVMLTPESYFSPR